jgi:hypothetical protein
MLKILRGMCCIFFVVVEVNQHCTAKPMPVFFLYLPNPRSTTLRVDDYLLSKVAEVGQEHQSLLLVVVVGQRWHQPPLSLTFTASSRCRGSLPKIVKHLMGEVNK